MLLDELLTVIGFPKNNSLGVTLLRNVEDARVALEHLRKFLGQG